MKDDLLQLIQITIELLNNCGWENKAKWFSEHKKAIETATQGSNEFNQHLNELDNVLSGMGSFSDLPLKDLTGKMSVQEVRNLQWELVEKIVNAIDIVRDS